MIKDLVDSSSTYGPVNRKNKDSDSVILVGSKFQLMV